MESNPLRGRVGRAAPVSLFILSARPDTKRPTERYLSMAQGLGTTVLDDIKTAQALSRNQWFQEPLLKVIGNVPQNS